MANRVAWLSKRVKIGGQWFVRKPIVKATGFVTEKVEHNGHPVHAPGTFVLEWYEAGKRQRKPLSDSTSEAQDALRKKLQTLEARAQGLTVVEDKGAKGKVSLEAAVREYLEEVKLNRAHKTHLAYKRALGMLVSANPGCDFVQDLERRNLMVHFIRAMKEAGLGDRTQNNLFGAIVTFLHAQGHPVVTRKDAPDYTETEIETYSTEELGQLFGACTPAERLVFQFFLGTGCREREVMFATWKDVDLTAGTFTVKAKPAMGFKPKDSEERTIPIPSSLVRDLKAWKVMHPKSLLIFPNGQGRPNGHLLRDLKNVALRGKLNCGHCNSEHFGKAVTCRTHAVCEQFYLHKFRHTFACMHLLAGVDVRTVQLWLGHSDLETTSCYLKAISGKQKGVREKVDATFAEITVKPMRQSEVATIQ
jgi:integrase/recombinase XerD